MRKPVPTHSAGSRPSCEVGERSQEKRWGSKENPRTSDRRGQGREQKAIMMTTAILECLLAPGPELPLELDLLRVGQGWAPWLTPVIPASQEVEAEGSRVQSQPQRQ